MISDKLSKALNDQIQAEMASSYLYLSMVAWCEDRNLAGFAHWMRMQAHEELLHAMRFFDFLHKSGGRVLLQPVAGPETEWPSPVGLFEAVLAHERVVTRRIHDLMTLAQADGDHATQAMLQWFVSEQVEEEATVDAVVRSLRMVGGEGAGLFMIDRELAARPVPTPPPV